MKKVTILYKDHNAGTFTCDSIKFGKRYLTYNDGIMDYSIQLSLVNHVFIDGRLEYAPGGFITKKEVSK